jgi:thiosulfate/3-mercaptopyruvate sulfurtransferase
MAKYAGDVLIETEELEGRLADENLRIVEVDEDTTLYEKGHIPGAVSWDWFKDLHEPLRREFVDEKGLQELLARTGVGQDTELVLYSGNNNWFAAYAYWLLKYRGFDPVKLLNGGRKKWELESRELVTEAPDLSSVSGRPRVSGTRPALRALRGEVINAAAKGEAAFVDVRSPEEYRGELLAPPHLPQEQAQVPGHIPGAVNITWSKAANEDGSFKSADDLKALYQGEGVTPDREVIAYCRIGERSSHTWFVLKELLGYEKVKNYDGSWTEYGSLVGVPVER